VRRLQVSPTSLDFPQLEPSLLHHSRGIASAQESPLPGHDLTAPSSTCSHLVILFLSPCALDLCLRSPHQREPSGIESNRIAQSDPICPVREPFWYVCLSLGPCDRITVHRGLWRPLAGLLGVLVASRSLEMHPSPDDAHRPPPSPGSSPRRPSTESWRCPFHHHQGRLANYLLTRRHCRSGPADRLRPPTSPCDTGGNGLSMNAVVPKLIAEF
jgi:hypothetical protein